MQNNSETRNIPEPIKREVRQRCGFGCIICGSPIYEYEHMNEWAIVKNHVAQDITLLCPDHHTEKTKGLLPTEIVRKSDERPFNIRNGESGSRQLYYYGTSCHFILGGNNFITDTSRHYPSILVPIVVDGQPLFSFTMYKGQLFLNVTIYDKDNNLVLSIKNNHLIYSVDSWDITFIKKTLTIRQAHKDILLKVTFETPNKVIVERGKLYYNGAVILLYKDKMIVGEEEKNQFINNTFRNLPIGFSIGESSFEGASAGVRIPNISRKHYKYN